MAGAADWRSATAYAGLEHCDRAMLAWEWLRRDARYRRAWADGGDPRAFGLIALEDPALTAPAARPAWHAAADPAVLIASAEPCSGPDAFDLARLGSLVKVFWDDGGIEHLLFCDGRQALRLDIVEGTVCDGPVRLAWQLSGIGGLAPQVESLRRLITIDRLGRFGMLAAPAKARARARKVALLIRAYDAVAAGASHRDVATAFFSVSPAHWRTEASSYRARTQRLIRAAQAAGRAGPVALLRDGSLLAPFYG